ncbi:MAG: hypothetical protein AAF919_08225 [Pseudomonadota bacterium]
MKRIQKLQLYVGVEILGLSVKLRTSIGNHRDGAGPKRLSNSHYAAARDKAGERRHIRAAIG